MIIAIQLTSDGIKTYAYPDGTTNVIEYTCNSLPLFNKNPDDLVDIPIIEKTLNINLYDGGLRVIEEKENLDV